MATANKTSNLNFIDSARANLENESDYLKDLEIQLKEIWSQFENCLETDGPGETARTLRERYFCLYRTYRQKKDWLKTLSRN